MRSKKYRYLNTKGTVLDNDRLQNYMERVAISHDINRNSKKNTYPIPRLKDNFKFIEKTYNLLNENIKLGINTVSAGEWLLDNFYIIEETYKTICMEMNLKKYKSFPGIANGMYSGFARCYVLASEIVSYTDNKIDEDILKLTISSYQKRKFLSMEEIWNLWIFLEIAIIENIRNICERIYASQLQKYNVENIIERLVERKEIKNCKFKFIKNSLNLKDMKYPFIEYMSYKLKMYGRKGKPYLEILEDQVKRSGITVKDAIKKEHYDVAISKVSMGNSIISLKEIIRVNFLSMFEEINGVEELLKKDPANVYSKMDFKTKDMYRNEIKKLSEDTKISEIYIADEIIKLAKKQIEDKKRHIGYYLISDGRNELLDNLGLQRKKKLKNTTKIKIYVFGVYLLTFLIDLIFGAYFYLKFKNVLITIFASLVTFIPFSEIAIQFVNYILSKTVKPKIIPKLDFSKNLPVEYATFVVIPTIINSKEKVKELIEKLEVYYLANKSENIYFAILGDCTASKNEIEKEDSIIIKTGLGELEKLNKKYGKIEFPIFHFLYRKRTWNESEGCYLGWERKRGLLCQFNEYLVDGKNSFLVNTINDYYIKNISIPKIKYVITLDSDTNLILDSALELIGAMAHVLNKPVLNKEKDLVIEGHGIIQPRIGIDLEGSRKSIFTKIYSPPRRD